jgi:F-type H+-transporting ATPase subunit b
MELLQALGLNVKILLAQLINFTILLLVLWKFGYQPMMKFLDERREKIEAGVKNSEVAQQRLAEIAEQEKAVMKQAQAEAAALIEKTNANLEERKKMMMEKAKSEIAAVAQKAKDDLEVEHKIAMKYIKQESAQLVMAAVEKIINEKMDAKTDAAYVEKIVREVSAQH